MVALWLVAWPHSSGHGQQTWPDHGERIERAINLPDGQLLRLNRAGPDDPRIIGGQDVVRLDRSGRLRWQLRADVAAPAGRMAVSVEHAVTRARRALAIGSRLRASRPVIWAVDAGSARIALQLDFAFDPVTITAPTVIVDGQTGRLLASDSGVHFASPRADVFAVSPAENAQLTRVSLRGLGEGAQSLTSSDLSALGCIDTRSCREISPGVVRHACTMTATASPNADGDFLYPYLGDEIPDDALPEVMAFYQIDEALAYLDQIGHGQLLGDRITAITNYRLPNGSSAGQCSGGNYVGTGDLAPFDSAFFTRSGEEITTEFIGPAVIFGQGRTVDFGLDGDVIVHEFGHAVTYAVAPDLVRRRVDRYGTDVSPAALHEAYSDVLAMMVHGSPVLGDYVGSGFGSGQPVRDLSVARRCPDNLTGNAHQDGRIFGSAVYAARDAIAGDAPERAILFDRAVVTAWAALPDHAGFEHAGTLTVMELEVVLGPVWAQMAEQVFIDHGVLGCGARVTDGAGGKVFSTLPGVADIDAGGAQPGPFQLRYQLAESAHALVLDVGVFDSFGLEPEHRQAMAVVKGGDEPIEWRAGEPGTWLSDHSAAAEVIIDSHRHGRAVIPGPFGPGVYHLMLVNQGAPAELHQTRVGFVPTDQPADCGCSLEPGGSVPAVFAILWLLIRRRRPAGG